MKITNGNEQKMHAVHCKAFWHKQKPAGTGWYKPTAVHKRFNSSCLLWFSKKRVKSVCMLKKGKNDKKRGDNAVSHPQKHSNFCAWLWMFLNLTIASGGNYQL